MNTPSIARPVEAKRSLPIAAGQSLFDWLFPNAKVIHRIGAVVALIALIVICSKIRFYLPGNPTPVTLQTFAILTAAGVMGFRWGVGTVIVYLLIGMMGFLAFANQPWGFTSPAEAWIYITGVTGGYLIGFVLAAAIAGALSQYGFDRANSLWANVLAGIAVYLPALVWLALGDFSWPAEERLLLDAMYVYLPGDFLKVVGASALLTGLWRYADNRRSGQE